MPRGRIRLQEFCSLEDCPNAYYAKGFCSKHYTRNKVHGSPHVVKRARLCGSASPAWKGSRIGYTGAHARIRAARGLATGHPCVACGEPASDWSLDHTAENLLYGKNQGRVCPYSPNPEDYSPRCRSCHTLYDLERVSA